MLFRVAPAQVSLGRFTGTDDTIRLMRQYALGSEGEQNLRVRQLAESIVSKVAPKDYLSEILALRAWATGPAIRYTNDPRHVEAVKTPLRCLLEIESRGVTLLDCDDITTLLCALGMATGKEASFVVVGFGESGKYSHVFARLREPKTGTRIVCDPVAGPNEAQMLRRVSTYKVIDLD
jgi:hypothetical protein